MSCRTRICLVVLLIIASFSTKALADSASVYAALNEFAWEKRQLVIFAPDETHAELTQFKQQYQNLRDEFIERRLQRWFIIGNKPVTLENTLRAELATQDFRQIFMLAPQEFQIILVGYDQEEKLRQSVVDIDALFGEIDLMPMRIQEMHGWR